MDNFTTKLSCSGPNIDNPVGCLNGLFVVFHDDEGVAEVSQFEEGVNEASVVSLVEANARLIENVEDAGEA